jgi:integrase
MFAEVQRSPETIADYEREATRLIAQYLRENPGSQPRAPLIQTTYWFLNSHGRWEQSTIRGFAAALQQEMETMLEYDTFDPASEEASLLWRLKNDRPKPTEKIQKSKKGRQVAQQKKVAAKKKKRKKHRKSLPVRELRALIAYFRSKDDAFSLWIVGYIILASRLGWRPGEILILQREGNILSASAKKRTNQRGLTDTCEIDISAYCERSRLIKKVSLVSNLDKWIADTRKWGAYYGGLSKLQDNINSRLATACKKRKIKRVCTYTFRHFAISCMKASGFSRSEIAVIVNHATDRTATEHYGKRRHGIKRARKLLSFDRGRLPLVREKARSFEREAEVSIKF